MSFLSEKDPTLKEMYDFSRIISHGSFGVVYEVRNKLTSEISALKIEYNEGGFKNRSAAVNQIHLLKKLQGLNGIPQIRGFGKCSKGCYMQVQLLQSSLQREAKKSFTIIELNKIARELLLILKQIHEKKVIHQDIKPQNIMKDKYGRYYFIDFGLSRIKSNDKKTRKNPGFIGTPRFASITAHQGKIQTEKDDIQSLFYVLAFLSLKKLPWFNISTQRDKKLNEIKRKKQLFRTEVFQSISKGFFLAFEYIIQLKNREQVNYQLLFNLLGKERNTLPTVILTNKISNQNLLRTQRARIQPLKYLEEESEQTMSRMAHIQCLSTIQFLTQNILFKNKRFAKELNSETVIPSDDQGPIQTGKATKNIIKFKNPFLNA